MEQKDYRLAAIMYTDISGFSHMMETNESGTLETLRRHNEIIGDSVKKNGGRVIKSVGDVFLSEFPNTADAVRSAVEIQDTIAEHNNSDPVMPIYLRIGIHLGDIYFFEDDALGEGVSIANRLQSLAHPGRICISQDVLNLVSSKVDLEVRPLGQSKLRGITREIPTYEVAVNSGAEDPQSSEREKPTSDASAHATAAEPGAPGRGDAGPGTAGPASGSGGGRQGGGITGALRANLSSPEYADFNELKALVLAEIKKAGRRLSIDDVRSRLPNRSGDIDAGLEKLADKGFLTRGPSGPGRPPGPRRPAGPAAARSIRRNVEDSMRSRESWEDEEWSWGPGHRRGTSHGRPDQAEEARIQAKWDKALTKEPVPASGYDTLVEDYKDHVAASAEKEKAGFRGHLISYAAVNGGLFFLWSMVMFGGFPWFLIVALAWGIGLASHYSGVRQKVRESRELDQWPSLTREQLRIYRKLVKARNNFSGHVVSNVATSIFLIILNLIVSPGFPWALFPVGFMAIGVFSHLPAFKSKERRLLGRLREAGANIRHLLRGKKAESEPAPRVVTGGPDTASYEAEQVRQRIVSKLAALPDSSPVGEDFEPVLDNYVVQIKLLDQKSRELDVIMQGIPVADLQRDLATLQKQRAETENKQVLAQYDHSIEQIEKQQVSFAELKNEREILRLRLSSSLSQLKQMEIDMARMASITSGEEVASIDMLKDKSDELSQYLEDLEAGYRELE